jgi:hypothetical protein
MKPPLLDPLLHRSSGGEGAGAMRIHVGFEGFHELPLGKPPLPGPPPLFGGLKERGREKNIEAPLPRAALAVLACPGLLSCCPSGALRFGGSIREISFRRNLILLVTPAGKGRAALVFGDCCIVVSIPDY